MTGLYIQRLLSMCVKAPPLLYSLKGNVLNKDSDVQFKESRRAIERDPEKDLEKDLSHAQGMGKME